MSDERECIYINARFWEEVNRVMERKNQDTKELVVREEHNQDLAKERVLQIKRVA